MKQIYKLYGGGGSSGPVPDAPYDPASDPGYKAAAKLLKSLQTQMDAANTKLTPAQIIASLPANVQSVLSANANPPPTPQNMSSWGNINNFAGSPQSPGITPQYAPAPTNSLYNGVSSGASGSQSNPFANYVYLASLLGTPPSSKG